MVERTGPLMTPGLIAAAVLPLVLVSVLSVVLAISFAAVVFSGPLSPHLSQGIGLGLFGALALGVVAALGASYRSTICSPQDVTAIILSLSAAAVAARTGGAGPETLYASVAVLIALASLATGGAFLLAGRLRLGALARFIPYPVLGGFLAATGYLILVGGMRMVAGPVMGEGGLAGAPALWRWVPIVGLGMTVLVVARLTRNPLALPAMLGLAFAGFYAGLLLAGIDLEEAGARGLLLGPFGADQDLWRAFRPQLFAAADYGAILAELPAILTLVGLALVGAVLNASGIELATGEPVDLDRDLRAVGLANLVAGCGGGLPGFHLLSDTLLAHRLLPVSSRLVGIVAGATAGLALVAGTDLLAVLPIGVFAAVLVYLGLDLLYDWLWVERRRLPLQDFAIVLLILGVAATVGFLEAVAVGIVAASVLFVIAYSRLEVIRARITGALRLSTIERSEAEIGRLTERGDETRIFELQGFVFFGTAHALYDQLSREIERPGAPVRNVILDFRRVQGVDVSAAFNFGKIAQTCERSGIRLLLTGMRPAVRRAMELAGVTGCARGFPTLDDGLAWVEEELLGEIGAADGDKAELAALVDRAADAGLLERIGRETVPAGTEVMRQGEASDALVLLEAGRLVAGVAGPEGGPMRVATFLPGAIVGEIGFYSGTLRTATVTAEIDSTIRRLNRADLDRLGEVEPGLAGEIHRLAAALLARRLARTTALLREVAR